MPLQLQPVSADERQRCKELLAAAMPLLQEGTPSLADEIGGLVKEVVLVRGNEGSGQTNFKGGSTFYLWGALFLNAPLHRERLDLGCESSP